MDEDTQAALEYLEYLNLLCTGCGHPRDESLNPELTMGYTTTPIVCMACADRERTAEARQRDDTQDTHGTYYSVTLNEEGQARR